MSVTNWLLKAVLLAALLPFTASAGSIFFTPAGLQLDGDSILDIYMKPGQLITFNVYYDGTGLFSGASTAKVNFLSYNVMVDTSELEFVSLTHNPDLTFGGFSRHASTGLGTDRAIVQGSGTPGLSTSPSAVSLVPVLLDTFVYRATAGMVNDGASDFGISIGTALTNVNVTNLFTPSSQIVEVQPNPEPGTWILMGAGVVMIGLARLRRVRV